MMKNYFKNLQEITFKKSEELGIPLRWPAIVELIDDTLPPRIQIFLKPFLKNAIQRYIQFNEPILQNIPFKISRFEHGEVELEVDSKNNIAVSTNPSIDIAILTAVASLPVKWCIQKYAPVGQLQFNTKSIELSVEEDFEDLRKVILRFKMNPDEVENLNRNLLTSGVYEFEALVNIFSLHNIKKAQAHLRLKINWTPQISFKN